MGTRTIVEKNSSRWVLARSRGPGVSAVVFHNGQIGDKSLGRGHEKKCPGLKTTTLIVGNLYMLYNNSCMFLYQPLYPY